MHLLSQIFWLVIPCTPICAGRPLVSAGQRSPVTDTATVLGQSAYLDSALSGGLPRIAKGGLNFQITQ
jgi:hypothetical protein